MTHPRTAALLAGFQSAFGVAPEGAVRAPGRVNLIGEHTDYNEGFCLPMAIDHDMRIAWRRRDDDQVRVVDIGMASDGDASFCLQSSIAKDPARRWADYPRGCAEVLLAEGIPLVGCDLAVSGNVPLGSGLSSSAAFEVATILALLAAARQELDPVRIAFLAQRAENQYVGTNCGILDQLASSCAVEGQAMLMDCRTLALAPVPLPQGVSVVIADTGKRRGLVDSAYNERRGQCEAAALALAVPYLRDATLHELRAALEQDRIDALTFARAAHVIAENGRTQAAAACLRAGDAEAVGALMDQSHADLRDRFAVTCPELDHMCMIARALPGCLGSRMTGAGFGGCTVSLVRDESVADFAGELEARYLSLHERNMAVYVTRPAAGAGALTVP